MELGQVINPQYDPTKNHVYEAFCEYYNNPILTKIKNISDVYSMYMIKIHAMLGNAFRYLLVIVDIDDNPLKFKKPMKECDWISLQSRTLEDHHDIPSHVYQSRKTPSLSQKIHIKTQDEKQSVYESETYPLTVTLLHTRKNHKYQYQPTGTIVSALETFQTIINFKN
jgi:hypothetical protein